METFVVAPFFFWCPASMNTLIHFVHVITISNTTMCARFFASLNPTPVRKRGVIARHIVKMSAKYSMKSLY
jgi:hypothetical protein